ncbi:MAG: RNA polymerase sigma factor [Acidimicrobiia bacterium]
MDLPDDQHTDRALAAAAAGGDRGAIDMLLARHLDRVHAVCRRILGNDQDALDATQEALIAISRGIGSFDGRSRFTTWCYRVATNAALDEARRRKRRPVAVEHIPERESREADPAARVADALDIDAALTDLPPEFRAAVALRDLEGLDYAEIATVLGIPPGTVRSRIARGRAALADRLGNPEDAADRPSPQTP